MINAEEFRDLIREVVREEIGDKSLYKIGEIASVGDKVSVKFSGEPEPSQKKYTYLKDYYPIIGDRVILLKDKGTYVVLGRINFTGNEFSGEQVHELINNLDTHMAESVSDGVHGLQVERGTATITINEAYQGTAHVSFGKTFKTPPFATAVAANIPGGYPFNLYRVYNQSTSGASFGFRENTDRHMTGTLEIEWIAIGF